MRLSVGQKYRTCQAVFALGFLVVIYCLSKLSPWSSPHHNVKQFWISIISVVITIAFALGFYYYRSKLHNVETGLIEIQTLAHSNKVLSKTDKTKIKQQQFHNK